MYLLLGFEIEHFPEFPSDVEFCNGKLLPTRISKLQSSFLCLSSFGPGTKPVLHSRRIVQHRQPHASGPRGSVKRPAGRV